MKKKMLCLMLASVMLMSVLGGCGSKDEKVPSSESEKSSVAASSSQEQESSVEEVPELEPVTIQMLQMGPGEQKDTAKVLEAFNEKLQEYVPNTTVEMTVVTASEYKDNLNRVLASGEPVDLAWVGYCSSLNEDMKDGNLMPLDDLLENYGQGIIESIGSKVLDMHRYTDGELYYVLNWQGLIGNKRGIYIPTEFVEAVEQVYPDWLKETQNAVDRYWNEETTLENYELMWDQFEKYFEVMKANDTLYAGFCNATFLGIYGIGFAEEQYISFGSAPLGVIRNDESYTVVDTSCTDFARSYFERVADWYQKGYVRKDILSVDGLKEVANGEWDDLCITIKQHNLLDDLQIKQREMSWGVDLEAIYVDRKPSLDKGSATAMAIPYCADDPERAMMVLNAIHTAPELNQLLVYGIEGEHYTYNDDGTITHVGLNKADSPYGLADWLIGTCENSLPESVGKIGYYDALKEAESDAYENPFLGFAFDPSEVADIVSAIKAINSEYESVLRQGAQGADWEAYYDELVAAHKAAGIDALIEEAQKQLDAYIAENNITGALRQD